MCLCLSLKDALRIVYGSALYQKLQNVETGLYREGPVYLYDMLCEERDAAHENVV